MRNYTRLDAKCTKPTTKSREAVGGVELTLTMKEPMASPSATVVQVPVVLAG